MLICDGDTKTATAIRTQIPELKDHVVIWNDLNHMAINFGKNLREETGLSAAEAALLQSSFARAVKQAREEEEKRRAHGEKKRSEVERVKSMRKRIVAGEWASLLQHDQLKLAQRGSQAFPDFVEAPRSRA